MQMIEDNQDILPLLHNLEAVYKVLNKRRQMRGSIDFDIPEVKVKLNAKGQAVGLVKREHGLGESIIEECMLVANETVAEYMAKKELFQKGDKFEWLVKRLGAFAVDRTKPEIATFKTVKDILSTSWSLGVFPQGGIRPYGSELGDLKKGFIVIAKNAKADIVPVAIGGFDGYPKLKPFTRRNVHLHVGKPISYKLSEEEIIYEWCRQISEHADYVNTAPLPASYKEEQAI